MEAAGTAGVPALSSSASWPACWTRRWTALRLTGTAADAEDLVQDAALLAHRGYPGFTRGSNFRAWFYRILVNRFYSNYRSQKRAGVSVDLDETPELYLYQQAAASGLTPDTDTATTLVMAGWRRPARAGRPPREFRTVATLYFMQDLPLPEIADMLDVPIGTVRSRLHRARRMQKALWKSPPSAASWGRRTNRPTELYSMCRPAADFVDRAHRSL
jgi:RNA polymerase sigma-70 factor (ECF subfamily)